jgi:hypothetical protein
VKNWDPQSLLCISWTLAKSKQEYFQHSPVKMGRNHAFLALIQESSSLNSYLNKRGWNLRHIRKVSMLVRDGFCEKSSSKRRDSRLHAFKHIRSFILRITRFMDPDTFRLNVETNSTPQINIWSASRLFWMNSIKVWGAVTTLIVHGEKRWQRHSFIWIKLVLLNHHERVYLR